MIDPELVWMAIGGAVLIVPGAVVWISLRAKARLKLQPRPKQLLRLRQRLR